MNDLEQLVRDSTNAQRQKSKLFGEHVSPGPANQRSCLCLPCCWGQMLLKQQPDPICLCSVSFPISVFLRTRFMLSSQGQGTSLKRRGLLASVKVHDTNNGKLLSPNHLRSLPAAPHSDLSARQYEEVFPGYDVRTSAWQHVFRGCFRS